MSDEAAIDWFKRENEALHSALAASQEREGRLTSIILEALDCAAGNGYYPPALYNVEEILRKAFSTPSDAGRGGWQAIETAPRDKQGILVKPDSNYYLAFGPDDEHVSHWMPLPQPPPASGEEKGGES